MFSDFVAGPVGEEQAIAFEQRISFVMRSTDHGLLDLQRVWQRPAKVSRGRLPNFPPEQITPSPSRLGGLTEQEEQLWTTQCVELIRTAGIRLHK